MEAPCVSDPQRACVQEAPRFYRRDEDGEWQEVTREEFYAERWCSGCGEGT
jgi:hypothetical protein